MKITLFNYEIEFNFNFKINNIKKIYDFVTLDTEFINNEGGIVSIGLGYWKNGKLVDTYYSLVCPRNPKQVSHCSEICGITYEQVKNERSFLEIWEEIYPTIDGCCLVGHSIQNDIKQMRLAYEQCTTVTKFKVPARCIKDTFHRSVYLIKGSKHSLSTVASILGVKGGEEHNALGDAITTGEVWLALQKLEHPIEIKQESTENNEAVVKVEKPKKQPATKKFKYGTYFKARNKKEDSFEWYGLQCAFTGTGANLEKLKGQLYGRGVNIMKNFNSGQTHIVVFGESPSKKIVNKAIEKGMIVLGEQDLMNKLGI